MRLSQAKIPTLLLIGNHDISPSIGRAHALQEFKTLQVPFVRVLDQPCFLKPEDLWGLPVQVIAMPWITRSGLMAVTGETDSTEAFARIEGNISELIESWLKEDADPSLPTILTAHASIEGAKFGGERLVMLGNDLVLTGSLVKNPRLDYVAMGHIHKPQDVNEGSHPPVIYPGSIERVDFGEIKEERFFILADVERGATKVEWVQLTGARKFLDCRASLSTSENVTDILKKALPKPKEMPGAIIRLSVEYPREWDHLIDETALRKYAEDAFEFHLVKRPKTESRIRMEEDQSVSSLSPLELLSIYFDSAKIKDSEDLLKLAQELLSEDTLDT
jgi:exonuclease SbcD